MTTFISCIILLAGLGFALLTILLVWYLLDSIINGGGEDWLDLIIIILISFIFSYSLIRGGIILWQI